MQRNLLSLIALFLFAGCLQAANNLPSQLHRYDIHVADDLSRLDIVACFDKAVPEFLVAGSSDATRYLDYMKITVDGKDRALTPQQRRVNVPQVPDDQCIRYSVVTTEIADSRRLNIGLRAGNSVMLALDYWLWRPPILDESTDIELRFHLPEDMSVSAPWPEVSTMTDIPTFSLGKTPYYWIGCIVVGKIHYTTLDVPGATLRLAMMDGLTATQQEQAKNWMATAADAVTHLYGEFPVSSPQILIIPVPSGEDAAPFARVVRGGGTAAHFLMNLSASQSDFDQDWVAVHELSHMSLPFLKRSDAWLSEGLASYYQNILRARAGLLSPVEAWQKLSDGFGRGSRGTRDGTLAEATERMGPDNNYMRVYWSGAAIALMADVELRKISGGELSLDVALQRLRACCLDSTRSWSGKEIMDKLDLLTGTNTFTTLYQQHVYSQFFPNLRPLFKQLGIETRDDRVSLNDDAPLARLRDSITDPHPTNLVNASLPSN